MNDAESIWPGGLVVDRSSLTMPARKLPARLAARGGCPATINRIDGPVPMSSTRDIGHKIHRSGIPGSISRPRRYGASAGKGEVYRIVKRLLVPCLARAHRPGSSPDHRAAPTYPRRTTSARSVPCTAKAPFSKTIYRPLPPPACALAILTPLGDDLIVALTNAVPPTARDLEAVGYRDRTGTLSVSPNTIFESVSGRDSTASPKRSAAQVVSS